MLMIYGTEKKTIQVERRNDHTGETKQVKTIGANGCACRMRFSDGTEILLGYSAFPEITWFIMEIRSGPAAKMFFPHDRRLYPTAKDISCSDVFKIDAELLDYALIDLWDTAVDRE